MSLELDVRRAGAQRMKHDRRSRQVGDLTRGDRQMVTLRDDLAYRAAAIACGAGMVSSGQVTRDHRWIVRAFGIFGRRGS